MMILLLLQQGLTSPSSPIWEEAQPHGVTYRMHRYLGYGIVAGSLVQVVSGGTILSTYEEGKTPSKALQTAHRTLGYAVVSLAVTNSLLGSWNLFSMKPEHRRRKHYRHAFLSWLATGGYVTAGILAYQARTLPEFDRYYAHRNAALAATGATLLTLGTIIW